MMKDESRSDPPFDLRLRTKQFALSIIRLCASLPASPESWIIRRQLGRCGTSVGAQYREACRARSKAEFISKMESALQELDETQYWLELLGESGLSGQQRESEMMMEADQLVRIFVASVRSSKAS